MQILGNGTERYSKVSFILGLLVFLSFSFNSKVSSANTPELLQVELWLEQFGYAIESNDSVKAAKLAIQVDPNDLAKFGFLDVELRDIHSSRAEALSSVGELMLALSILDPLLVELKEKIESSENKILRANFEAEYLKLLMLAGDIASEADQFGIARHYYKTHFTISKLIYGISDRILIPVLKKKILADKKLGDVVEADIAFLEFLDGLPDLPLETLGGEKDGKSKSQLVKIFYGSSRELKTIDSPKQAYGTRRGETTFGSATVSVPNIRTPGSLSRPGITSLWRENENAHIILKRVEQSGSRTEFALSLASAVRSEPKVETEAFVFIHGFNVSFEDAALRTGQLAIDLDMRTGGIFYSWPSGEGLMGYQVGQNNVENSVAGLVALLDIVTRQVENVHLIAHSMGSRVLLDALDHLLKSSNAGDNSKYSFGQVVFASPDKDAEIFGQRISKYKQLSKDMTVYASSRDRALELSQKLGDNYPRAGQAPPIPIVARAISVVDTTQMDRRFTDIIAHSDFAEAAIEDLRAIIWFNLTPKERCPLILQSLNGQDVYWKSAGNRGCTEKSFRRAVSLMRLKGDSAEQSVDEYVSQLKNLQKTDELPGWLEVKRILTKLGS